MEVIVEVIETVKEFLTYTVEIASTAKELIAIILEAVFKALSGIDKDTGPSEADIVSKPEVSPA